MNQRSKVYLVFIVSVLFVGAIVLFAPVAFGRGPSDAVEEQVRTRLAAPQVSAPAHLEESVELVPAETTALLNELQNFENLILNTEREQDLRVPEPKPAEREQQSVKKIHAGQNGAGTDAREEKFISEIIRLKRRINTLEESAARKSEVPRPSINGVELERLRLERAELINRLAKDRSRERRDATRMSALERENKQLQIQLGLAQTQLDERSIALQDKASLSDKLAAAVSERDQLKQERAEIVQRSEEMEQTIEKLLANLATQQKKSETFTEQFSELKKAHTSQKEELENTSRQLSRVIDEARSCGEDLEKTNQQLSKIGELQAELNQQAQVITSSKDAATQCQSNLSAVQQQLMAKAEVERKLIEAQNELLLRDKEVELLSGTKKSQKSSAAVAGTAIALPQDVPAAPASRRLAVEAENTTSRSVGSRDALIVRVTGAKVNLRTGPGEEHSPLMQVKRGSQLTVEDREGDWFRVFTPTGGRAYVRNDVVTVVPSVVPTSASNPARGSRASLRKGPARAPRRAGNELVPFGSMKLAGSDNSQDQKDVENEALQKLRQQMLNASSSNSAK